MSDSTESELQGPRENVDEHARNLPHDTLVERFHNHVERDKKTNTARFYKRNLSPFIDFVERHNGHVTDVGEADLVDHLQDQAEQYAPKTVGHRHSAVSYFFSWLHDTGLLNHDDPDPSERVDASDVGGMSEKTRKEMAGGEDFHYLTPDEVGELIENVPAPELRNRATISLMANTGMRASETARVRVEDIDLGQKNLTVHSPKKSDKNQQRKIEVYWRSESVSDTLDTYLEFGRPTNPFADESPYLFPSKQSERVSTNMINRAVKLAAEKAGLQESTGTDGGGNERNAITSHVLRHSYAMAALDNGMSIKEVRDNLHHSSIDVTMKYLREHEEDRRRAVERHGPQF